MAARLNVALTRENGDSAGAILSLVLGVSDKASDAARSNFELTRGPTASPDHPSQEDKQ